jgi:hypothetical protein
MDWKQILEGKTSESEFVELKNFVRLEETELDAIHSSVEVIQKMRVSCTLRLTDFSGNAYAFGGTIFLPENEKELIEGLSNKIEAFQILATHANWCISQLKAIKARVDNSKEKDDMNEDKIMHG